MKTRIFLMSMVMAGTTVAHAQVIPNPGFENWTFTAGQFFAPDDWETNATDFSIVVVPENPGHSGLAALQLNLGGYARTDILLPTPGGEIRAWVKYQAAQGDTVRIIVQTNEGGVTIPVAEWIGTTSYENWTQVWLEVPDNSGMEWEILIECGFQPGTTISVDDFEYLLPLGLSALSSSAVGHPFPNPFSQSADWWVGSALSDGRLIISDASGRQVCEVSGLFGERVIIERATLAPGIYTLSLSDRGRPVAVSRIVITD